MKAVRYFVLVCLLVVSSGPARAQGTFVNLNFEWASNPLWGWTAYLDGEPVDTVLYNNVSDGPAAVSIHDAASPLRPIELFHSVFLQAAISNQVPAVASLAQVNLVPQNVNWLLFSARASSLQVAINGQLVPTLVIGNNLDYTTYAVDVARVSGQIAEIRFICSPLPNGGGNAFLDNIIFSTSTEVRPQ